VTDLNTRESVLLCQNKHPILQLSLQEDTIWVTTTDSSVYGWPAEGQTPQKIIQKGGSFLAGNLSFTRTRASIEGSVPVSMTVILSSN
jgi:WD repeat-containing protein 48